MKKQYIGLIAVLVLVLVIVLVFVLYNQWPLMTGKHIVLDTRPVDPFDPFRGQYMTIGYEISTITHSSVGFSEEDTIYVSLKEDDEGIWRSEGASKTKPALGDFIKGKVTSVSGNRVNVDYGIEQYFFERHADLPTRNITVEVSVASSGRAKLVQLLHNGEPVVPEYEEFDIKS